MWVEVEVGGMIFYLDFSKEARIEFIFYCSYFLPNLGLLRLSIYCLLLWCLLCLLFFTAESPELVQVFLWVVSDV